MLSLKNVKISKSINGLEVDFNVAGQEFIKAEVGRKYNDFFEKNRGMVAVNVEFIKEKVKSELKEYSPLTNEIVKNVLTNVLSELQGAYDSIKQNFNFSFEIEEFTGNTVETTTIQFDCISKRENISFFDKKFEVDELDIEESQFSGKLKSFLQRFKDNRYQRVIYIYSDFSPEENTEVQDVRYDLLALEYEVLDEYKRENKTIYITTPIQIICKIFGITPYELFECSDDAFSRVDYQNIKNN